MRCNVNSGQLIFSFSSTTGKAPYVEKLKTLFCYFLPHRGIVTGKLFQAQHQQGNVFRQCIDLEIGKASEKNGAER